MKRNPVDEALAEIMDAWMDMMNMPISNVMNQHATGIAVPSMRGNDMGDFEDKNGEITLTVDMPGVEKKDIELNVDTFKVSVKAETETLCLSTFSSISFFWIPGISTVIHISPFLSSHSPMSDLVKEGTSIPANLRGICTGIAIIPIQASIISVKASSILLSLMFSPLLLWSFVLLFS